MPAWNSGMPKVSRGSGVGGDGQQWNVRRIIKSFFPIYINPVFEYGFTRVPVGFRLEGPEYMVLDTIEYEYRLFVVYSDNTEMEVTTALNLVPRAFLEQDEPYVQLVADQPGKILTLPNVYVAARHPYATLRVSIVDQFVGEVSADLTIPLLGSLRANPPLDVISTCSFIVLVDPGIVADIIKEDFNAFGRNCIQEDPPLLLVSLVESATATAGVTNVSEDLVGRQLFREDVFRTLSEDYPTGTTSLPGETWYDTEILTDNFDTLTIRRRSVLENTTTVTGTEVVITTSKQCGAAPRYYHKVRWEQIDGTPVMPSDGQYNAPTFSFVNAGGNFEFLLHFDEGFPYASTDTIGVFNTPRSYAFEELDTAQYDPHGVQYRAFLLHDLTDDAMYIQFQSTRYDQDLQVQVQVFQSGVWQTRMEGTVRSIIGLKGNTQVTAADYHIPTADRARQHRLRVARVGEIYPDYRVKIFRPPHFATSAPFVLTALSPYDTVDDRLPSNVLYSPVAPGIGQESRIDASFGTVQQAPDFTVAVNTPTVENRVVDSNIDDGLNAITVDPNFTVFVFNPEIVQLNHPDSPNFRYSTADDLFDRLAVPGVNFTKSVAGGVIIIG